MIIHIKPTCPKESLFRFKANFIRLYRTFDQFKGSISEALTAGIEQEMSGIAETSSNIEGMVSIILDKHQKACMEEIRGILRDAASELSIPLT